MKSILDPKFKYTPAVSTDVRKTFARIRRKLRKQATTPQLQLPLTNQPRGHTP